MLEAEFRNLGLRSSLSAGIHYFGNYIVEAISTDKFCRKRFGEVFVTEGHNYDVNHEMFIFLIDLVDNLLPSPTDREYISFLAPQSVGVERDLAIVQEFLIPTGIIEPIDPISPIRFWSYGGSH